MLPSSKCALSLLVLAVLLVTSRGARILGVFPLPVTSHQNVMTALTMALAEKGHDVTVLTPVPQKNLPSNYREIILGNHYETIVGKHAKADFFSTRESSSFESTVMLWKIGIMLCEMTLPDPALQDLVRSQQKFDLVVIEAFNTECFLGISHIFDAPMVQVSPLGGADVLGDAVGNPTPYAYVPDFSLHYNHHMAFPQRLYNTLLGAFKSLGRYFYSLPRHNALMHQYLNDTGSGPMPYASDINLRTSLVLLNSHVSISDPKPFLPNVIEVGGMHVRPPKKLPQDLQKLMDDSKEGVVYFSLGSNLRSAQLPPEKLDALLKAFSKLKQKVIWKWETESMPGQPKNVKTYKWLPQSDLLAHPNLKAFVTHGGLLSIQEALYHGVPIVGIPVFGDQPMNMERAVLAGYGVRLDFVNITAQSMSEALDAVLNKPQYSETARRMSRRFRDQPMTPLETAVFWTEYVIRHKGAHHLHSAARELCWFRYHLLDVLGALAAGLFVVFYLAYLMLRTCVRCVLPTKKKPAATDAKKKKK